MKKLVLTLAIFVSCIPAFSQHPANLIVPASSEAGEVEEPANVVVEVTGEETTISGEQDEEATGLSTSEAEEIKAEVEEAISGQLKDDEEVINVGTPQVIRETVVETTTVPATLPQPQIEEEVELVEEEVEYDKGSSLDDIINTQGRLTENVSTEKHFESVWSRKGYFNISYNNSKLEPQKQYLAAYIDGKYQNIETMESDWGVGIQYGRNYNLLKKPIANIVMINLDYTPLDFNVNHYKGGDAKILYDSNDKNDNEKNYLPWNVEKFEFNYGMNLGPSITLAPFTKINKCPGLHFLKFNVYYHIGYHVSLLHFNPKKEQDGAPNQSYSNIFDGATSKLCIGYGLTNAVGFNVSWKSIGIGYETRWASLNYQSLDSSTFGKEKYKFKSPTNRVYIEFRL